MKTLWNPEFVREFDCGCKAGDAYWKLSEVARRTWPRGQRGRNDHEQTED